MYRVFQSVRYLNLAGTENVFMNWYRYINRDKIHFDFGVNNEYHNSLVEEIKQKGGDIIIIPRSKGIIGAFKYLFKLYKVLREKGPYDVFHSHEQWFGGLTCLVAKMAGIKKRFLISHAADTQYNRSLKKKLLTPLARIVIRYATTSRLAVSQEAGVSLYGNHMPFVLVHNGIDLKRFAYNAIVRSSKRKELGLEDKFVVGHVGRFAREKNHKFLVDIFEKIYKKNRQARLVLLGIGDMENAIRKQVAKLGLTDAVLFMGTTTNIQDFYQVFDVFIFPSLYEGLGIVSIEAQCSGLPCIMSDVIPREAFICNATALSLSLTSEAWANCVLEKIKNFVRKDESNAVRKAGFDAVVVGKFMEQEYLQ